MTTALHEERLAAAIRTVEQTGARTILDLGCGTGDLILRLARQAAITRITGLDTDLGALQQAQARLAGLPAGLRGKVQIAQGSMTRGHRNLRGHDCACLVETIEHLPPADLNRLERALFADMRPRHVIVTTPNAEYNTLLGVPAHRYRHPDHRFEWSRARFGRWAEGIAARNGYAVATRVVGAAHPTLGSASQMAVFCRADQAA